MGYGTTRQKQMEDRPWEIHPIWRGIGCIVMLLVPVISFAAAKLLVDKNLEEYWILPPADLMIPIDLPMVGVIHPWFRPDYIALAAVLTIAGFGILMILYTIMYSLLGPSRYGPVDSPPIRKKATKKRR